MPLILLVTVICSGLMLQRDIQADEPKPPATPVKETRFAEPASLVVQDIETRDVFTLSKSSAVQRYTAEQLTKGNAAPIATAKLEGEPQRLIVREIGDQRFVFVQCSGPAALYQLNADTLEVIRGLPLATSTVTDLFGSRSKTDPYVWMIVDGKPVNSKSAVRRWKLVVANFSNAEPTITDVRECSAAMVSPDGRTLLFSGSTAGIAKGVLSETDKPAPVVTVQPQEASLAKVRLRTGSFFSPDLDAIISGGEKLLLSESTVATGEAAPQPDESNRSIIGFLRSVPATVIRSELVRDDGTREAAIELSESTSGEVFTALTTSDFGNDTNAAEWRVFDATDASGLLLVSSSGCRLLPVSQLPETLAAHLSAPPMMLTETPDLLFKIGYSRDVKIQASDARCTIEVKSLPEGSTFENGVFSWQPKVGQLGVHPVDIELKAGSATKRIRLSARSVFDIQTLPHKYLRLAYLPTMKIIAGYRVNQNRGMLVDILKVTDTDFEIQKTINFESSATAPLKDMVLTSLDDDKATLAMSFAQSGTVLMMDLAAEAKATQINLPVRMVTQLSASQSGTSKLLMWCGSQHGDSNVDTVGLIDLKSGKDLGLITLTGELEEVHPSRLVVRPQDNNQPQRQIGNAFISHASLSTDGRSIHIISTATRSNIDVQYSEWSIPESRDGDSFELTCLHRASSDSINSNPLHVQYSPLRMQSGSTGYAAINNRVFVFGQSVSMGESPFAATHFVSGRPYVVTTKLLNDTNEMPPGGAISCSIYSLNSRSTVSPEFTLPLRPLVNSNNERLHILCKSDESARAIIAGFDDQWIRVPYAAIGIGDDRFGPELIVGGPRVVQYGGQYEFPFNVQPPEAKVTISKAPAGVTLEANRLMWHVPDESPEEEVASLTVTDGDRTKSVDLNFRVVAAVPVTIGPNLRSLSFDPESEQLAAVNVSDGSVVVFQLADLVAGKTQPRRTIRLQGREQIQCAVFKRVGDQLRLVVSHQYRDLSILDAETGEPFFDGPRNTNAVIQNIHAASDSTSPVVILTSGDGSSFSSTWQVLNVATGELLPPHGNHHFAEVSDDGSSITYYDSQNKFCIADLRLDVPRDMVNRQLASLRQYSILDDQQSAWHDRVDFDFLRVHQRSNVFAIGHTPAEKATSREQPTPLKDVHPHAFFRKSPFLLSLVDRDVANNVSSPSAGASQERTVTLSAVSRNTLATVGRSLALRFPKRTSVDQHGHLPGPPFSIFLTNDETRALISNNHSCFIVPVASLKIPQEVSLALKTRHLEFQSGEQSTVDIQKADSLTKLSLVSPPNGMTLDGFRLTWSPKISDAKVRSIEVEITSGELKRTQSIPMTVKLPEVSLPFVARGVAANPEGTAVFVWSDASEQFDSVSSVTPCCIVDPVSRKVTAKGEVSPGVIRMALCDGDHVILAMIIDQKHRLVVLKASDLTEVARQDVPLTGHEFGQLGLDAVNKHILLPYRGGMARCSIPDLKWVGGEPEPPAANLPSFIPILKPDAIHDGYLIRSPDGTPMLFRPIADSVLTAGSFDLQAARAALQREFNVTEGMAFANSRYRFTTQSPSVVTHVPSDNQQPGNTSRSPALCCTIASRERHGGLSPASLRVSLIGQEDISAGIAKALEQLRQTELDRDSASTLLIKPGTVELRLAENGTVDAQGVVSANDHYVIAAARSRMWVLPVKQLDLSLPEQSDATPQPRFVRQQSEFVMKGDGSTKLIHKITPGGEVRFLSTRQLDGTTLDPVTGELTIDHSQIRQATLNSLTNRFSSINNDSLIIAETIENLRRESRRHASQVISDPELLSEHTPFFVPISISLQSDGRVTDSLSYTVVLLIDNSEVQAAIDNLLKMASDLADSSPSRATNGEVRQLRDRVKELEDRLRRVEQTLRDNSLPVPER